MLFELTLRYASIHSATFDALQKDGHDVLLVGYVPPVSRNLNVKLINLSPSPAVQQSGRGGTFVLPTTNITAPGGEFGSIPVGAPFFGQNETNKNICA